ncbi:MAG: HNH endonuclease [Eubacteriaceae bacterium]|nr:HNH endonuclease [Eubacteriaceae bacterium]
MIKIRKRPLPEGTKISKEEDYRRGILFQMLVEDCCGKCYICEDSVHTAPNIEHRVSHRGNPSLKFDWNNLFLSCSHCNNTKSDRYDGIIDPSKADPEQFIELSLAFDEDLREIVIVRKIKGDRVIDTTVRLLYAVYNGYKTDIKKYASHQLKNKISNELCWFQQKIEEFKLSPNDESKAMIERMVSDSSVFAAFKKGILKADKTLSKAFGYS